MFQKTMLAQQELDGNGIDKSHLTPLFRSCLTQHESKLGLVINICLMELTGG